MPSLEDRLTAWGEWSRRRCQCSPHATGSIEGHWRTPQRWDATPSSGNGLGTHDCLAVEAAWRSMRELRHKALLWMLYPRQWSQRRIMFVLSDMPGPMLYPADWDSVYDAAHADIGRLLERPEAMPCRTLPELFPAA